MRLFPVLLLLLAAAPAVAQTAVFKIEDAEGRALLLVNDDGSISLPNASATNGFVLTTDADGNASWQPAPSGTLTLPFSTTYSSTGDAFSIVVDNVASGSAAVFENTNAGNGEAPLVARTNSIVGTAALFDGNVEVTGDVEVSGEVDCDGCIGASDVDPFGGVYTSKSSLYIDLESQQIAPNACAQIMATCNDANDLPIHGYCDTVPLTNMFVRGHRTQHWDSETEAATYICEVCNEPGEPVRDGFSNLICLTVN